MKPFLFPFTYMDTPEGAACGRYFETVRMLQFSNRTIPPELQTLADAGLAEFVMPNPAARLSFETAIAETENWARTHGSGAASYAKGYPDAIPFFSATSVSQIRQDIRRVDPRSPSVDTDEKEMTKACVFLHVAQAFDIQNQSISLELSQQASMEKTLFEALRGGATLESPDRIEAYDDPAGFMLLDRLTAWSRVWMASGGPQDLFVTTRPAVIDLVQEHLTKNEDLILAATVPADAPERCRTLESYCRKLASTDAARIAEADWLNIDAPPSAVSDRLRIYLLAGTGPKRLFGRFAGPIDAGKAGQPGGGPGDAVNTVVGLIEPRGTQDDRPL